MKIQNGDNMLFDAVGGFFLMVFGITVINVGIWLNRELNGIEYDDDARKGILITTCILGIIIYIINFVNYVEVSTN